MTRPALQALAACVLLAATACHGGPSSSFVPSAPLGPQLSAGAPDTPSPLKLSAKNLAFAGAATTLAKTLTASESNYTGTFTEKNTCAKIAKVSPSHHKGPKAKFKVTPIGAGACTVTVSDALKHTAVAKIKVTIVDPHVSPAALSFDQTGASAKLPFTTSQTGFKAAFKESDTCAGIATVAASSWSGPSAPANVTPVAAGTCTITVSNGQGGSSNVSVTVTTSGVIIQ